MNQSHSSDAAVRRLNMRRLGLVVLLALPLLAAAGLAADWWIAVPADEQPAYVGRQSCKDCHRKEYELWQDSHHDLAMDLATAETVLGDFNDASLEHYGVASKMFTKDGKYIVRTEGETGRMQDFEVKYVFGVEPLQQYMVETHRPAHAKEHEIGQVQVLPLVWDVKAAEWYYLDPPDVHEKLAPDDRLHWTNVGANWNRMCADCHSTNLEKNFDVQAGAYHTTFSEIDVSCEACHGPASIHVKLAESNSLFWDRNHGYGLAKLKGADHRPQIESCAPCHMRRHRVVAKDYVPGSRLNDYFAAALINPGLYHADGQILDEVYVYGSYVQSKMYHKGIRCTDCHDPHTTKLKHEGNKLCTSCHTHSAGKYDTPAHHHHPMDSSGARCVECHMPHSVYMEVDARRDHSLRIPRPDLSVKLGTPNACTGCHLEDVDQSTLSAAALTTLKREHTRNAEHDYQSWLRVAAGAEDAAVREEIGGQLTRLNNWARKHTLSWYGDKTENTPHYAAALAAAFQGDEDAERELIKVAKDRRFPAMARASAISQLYPYAGESTRQAVARALSDDDPQVRFSALGYYDATVNELARTIDEAETQAAAMAEAIAAAAGESPQGAAMLGRQREQRLSQAQQARDTLEQLARRPAELLGDPSRLVRSEAGRVLAAVPPSLLTAPQRKSQKQAIKEYEQGLLTDNDWALSHLSLGLLYEHMAQEPGEYDKAVKAYRTAIHVEPDVTGPRSNLAELLTRLAERAASREQAADLQADALRLRRDETKLLGREADLLPDNAELRYRYGLSLYLIGEEEQAIAALKQAHHLAPDSTDILLRLALLYKKRRQWDETIGAMNRLLSLQPGNAMFQHILQETYQEAGRIPPRR